MYNVNMNNPEGELTEAKHSLAAQMEEILNRLGGPVYFSANHPMSLQDRRQAALKHKDKPSKELFIQAAYTEKGRIEQLENHPRDFSLPIYYFSDDSLEDLDQYLTTPHGPLPRWVIGSDGYLYYTYNFYLFDQSGHAAKYQGIMREVTLKEEKQQHLQRIGAYDDEGNIILIRLEFNPYFPGGFVDLEPGDYEHIQSLLSAVHRGDYARI